MIRRFETKDKDDYIRMSKDFYSSPAVCHNVDEKNFIKTFDNIIAGSPYVDGFIVEYEGKTVGYGIIALSYSNEAGGMQIFLDELYILKEYRSHGLGKEYFEYVENMRNDIKRFRLEITPTNERAGKLYKRLGYDNLDYLQMIKDID